MDARPTRASPKQLVRYHPSPHDPGLSNIQLVSSRRGSGPALVVVRQLTGKGWAPVIGLLAREREVVAVDLPGFNDSPPLPEGTAPTVHALAAEVARWFSTTGLPRPPVVGNSLGGAVVLELARTGAVSNAQAVGAPGAGP